MSWHWLFTKPRYACCSSALFVLNLNYSHSKQLIYDSSSCISIDALWQHTVLWGRRKSSLLVHVSFDQRKYEKQLQSDGRRSDIAPLAWWTIRMLVQTRLSRWATRRWQETAIRRALSETLKIIC